jgi:flagellar assembly protein FliH
VAALIKHIIIKHDALVLGEDVALRTSSSVDLDESFSPFGRVATPAFTSQTGTQPMGYQPLIDDDKAIINEGTLHGVQPDEKSLNKAKIEAEIEAKFEAEIEARVQERLTEYDVKLKQAMDEAHDKGFTQGVTEGRAKGLESGEAEGRAQGIAKYQNAIELLDSWQCKANEQLQNIVSDAEEIIGTIVFEAVCKIIGDTLKTREGISAVISTAINGVKHEDILAIQVSPKDFKILSSNDESELNQDQTRLMELGLEENREIESGGCIVQLKAGRIDARIDTQLRAFAQGLKKAARKL